MNRIRLSLLISLIALGGLLTACPAPGDGAASEGRPLEESVELENTGDPLEETDSLDGQ